MILLLPLMDFIFQDAVRWMDVVNKREYASDFVILQFYPWENIHWHLYYWDESDDVHQDINITIFDQKIFKMLRIR